MAKKLYIKKNESECLAETYRRLSYFHKGNVNTKLMLLANKGKAKELKERGIIEPSSTETRGANWYKLTTKGKTFFNLLPKHKLTDDENYRIYESQSLPQNIMSIYYHFLVNDIERTNKIIEFKESKKLII